VSAPRSKLRERFAAGDLPIRWLGPSPHESSHSEEAHQHQGADQQQQDGYVELEGARVEASRDDRTELPTQNHAGGRKRHRSEQRCVLLRERSHEWTIQTHEGRCQASYEDDQDRSTHRVGRPSLRSASMRGSMSSPSPTVINPSNTPPEMAIPQGSPMRSVRRIAGRRLF
jgi:hypothetical protein